MDSKGLSRKLLEMVERQIKGSEVQLSDGWFAARMGRITGSKLGEIVPSKGMKMPFRANDYINEKIMERLTGFSRPVEDKPCMSWGREHEEAARLFASEYLGEEILEVGSITMPWSNQVSSSPDGIGVDADGVKFVYEAKCPMSHTHNKNLVSGKMPSNYVAQIQGHMACTDAEYGIFHSYDPRFPAELQHMLLKVQRDDSKIALMEELTLVAVGKIEAGVKSARKNAAESLAF